jgi:5-methyltetrahydrofolate--homocysteine methyltransferase
MAAQLAELLEEGVTMVGGCCGTTPEHIAAFRRIVEKWNAH